MLLSCSIEFVFYYFMSDILYGRYPQIVFLISVLKPETDFLMGKLVQVQVNLIFNEVVKIMNAQSCKIILR